MRYLKILAIFIFISNSFLVISYSENYNQPWDPALRHSVQGMQAYQNVYETMMNNTVNSNTPGYKEIAIANYGDGKNIQNKVFYRFTQGTAIRSGGSLDILIEGPGFFVLKCPWGYGYTRDGRFTLDQTGRLVTINTNFPVLGESGEIYLPVGKIGLTGEGVMIVDTSVIDVIRIVNFDDPEKLRSFNGSVFYFSNSFNEKYSDVDTHYYLRQGYYESSNVNMTGQLTQIPIVKNVYDANTRAIKLIVKSLNAGISVGNPQ